MSKKINQDLIFENYQQLVNGVVHYQSQQNEIRILCIKLILGTMGIVGLLGIANLGLSRYWFSLIASVLPLLTLVAITSNMLNDLFYREQMKMGFFLEAKKLEEKYFWIPRFHHCLLIEESDRKYYSPGKVQIGFYKRCVLVLFILSSGAFIRFPLFTALYVKIIIALVFVIFFRGYFWLVDYFIKVFFGPYILKEKISRKKSQVASEKFISLMHARGKDLIQNLSDIKMKYKNFTLTIITMIFLAGAYFAGSRESFWGVDEAQFSVQHQFVTTHKVFMITFLAFLSITSIGLIRYMDIRLCHAQMRNLFLALKSMEEIYPNLSKPFAFLTKSLYGKRFDPIIIESIFYSAFTFGILVMTFMIILMQKFYSGVISASIVLFVMVLTEIWSLYQTNKQKILFK